MTQAQAIRINDRVRVTRDIGDLAVRVGDVGVVCSIWQQPMMAYEVEFRRNDPDFGMRAVVFHGQLEALGSDLPDAA